MGDTFGGLAASRAHAAGAFCRGTLVRRAAVGGGGSRSCHGHAEGCMRDWEAQLRHGEKAYNYQNLTKNLPLKGDEGGGDEGCVRHRFPEELAFLRAQWW